MFEALSRLEGPFLLWVQEAVRTPVADALMIFYTGLGDHGILWIALCLLLLCFPKTRKAGIAGGLALLFSFLLVNVTIKPLVARPRPWLVVEGLVNLVWEGAYTSFPSGHTSSSFAAAWALYRTLPCRTAGVAALAAAALMGLSRLYLGVHFPSDVLFGALVGVLCGELARRLVQRAEKIKSNRGEKE